MGCPEKWTVLVSILYGIITLLIRMTSQARYPLGAIHVLRTMAAVRVLEDRTAKGSADFDAESLLQMCRTQQGKDKPEGT